MPSQPVTKTASLPILTFRQATKADVPLIMQMLQESAAAQGLSDEIFTVEADLERDLFGKTPRAWVVFAEVDGQPAGLVVYFFNFASFIGCSGIYMEDIYVREAFRGQGIAKQLMRWLANHAEEQGCGLLEWLVLDGNSQAEGFYERMGSTPYKGWTINRIKGQALKELAKSV